MDGDAVNIVVRFLHLTGVQSGADLQAEILDDLTQEARVLGDVDFERAAALIAERL